MDKAEITFKIELLGHLLAELQYWDGEDMDLAFADQKYDETLAALKEMKGIVLEELEGYFLYVRTNNEPPYLPYYQIYRDLKNAKFGE